MRVLLTNALRPFLLGLVSIIVMLSDGPVVEQVLFSPDQTGKQPAEASLGTTGLAALPTSRPGRRMAEVGPEVAVRQRPLRGGALLTGSGRIDECNQRR